MSANNANGKPASTAATVEPATKIAVVTGANKLDGIGFATAKQLAALPNTHVVLTGRAAADGPKVLDELKKAGHSNVSYELLDHCDAKSVEKAFDAIYAKHKRVDILVNNAGLAVGNADAGIDTKINDVVLGFDANTVGPLRTILVVAPRMKAQGYGRIVNVTSLAGDFALLDSFPGMIAYRVAKLSTNAISKVLALELKGTGVLVNSYAPGPVETDMMKKGRESLKGKVDFDAFGGIITPDKCAVGLVRLATLPIGSTETGLIIPDR